jgi:hypothetical protein
MLCGLALPTLVRAQACSGASPDSELAVAQWVHATAMPWHELIAEVRTVHEVPNSGVRQIRADQQPTTWPP